MTVEIGGTVVTDVTVVTDELMLFTDMTVRTGGTIDLVTDVTMVTGGTVRSYRYDNSDWWDYSDSEDWWDCSY